jgi:hypothetical protein
VKIGQVERGAGISNARLLNNPANVRTAMLRPTENKRVSHTFDFRGPTSGISVNPGNMKRYRKPTACRSTGTFNAMRTDTKATINAQQKKGISFQPYTLRMMAIFI